MKLTTFKDKFKDERRIAVLKTTENKSSCQLVWVACKKNDLIEKNYPNQLGLELKRMQGEPKNGLTEWVNRKKVVPTLTGLI